MADRLNEKVQSETRQLEDILQLAKEAEEDRIAFLRVTLREMIQSLPEKVDDSARYWDMGLDLANLGAALLGSGTAADNLVESSGYRSQQTMDMKRKKDEILRQIEIMGDARLHELMRSAYTSDSLKMFLRNH